MKSFEEAVAWLEGVPRYSKKDGLENMYKLMERFGNPQKRFHVIHVAGTNGKGSCCAMLAQVLTEAGYRVGRYVSPHLVDYSERISLMGEDISHERFLELAIRVRREAEAMQAQGQNHPTFFELITAIGFLAFAEAGVDWVVLETGVGGRLDSTNILEAPDLCLIASVSLDHTKVLGSTVEAIAGEKAGIIKPGVPIVLGRNLPGVQRVVSEKAAEKKAPYIYAGAYSVKLHYNDERGIFCNIASREYRYGDLSVRLSGDFQIDNLAAVLSACEELIRQGVLTDRRPVREGLKKVFWPGRMESVSFRGRSFLIDGAHNPDAAHRLSDFLSARGGSWTLCFSALSKKDVDGVLKELAACPVIDRVIFAPLTEGTKSIPYEEAKEIWLSHGGRASFDGASGTADALCLAAAEAPDRIVCAGSLYFVGEILAFLQNQES